MISPRDMDMMARDISEIRGDWAVSAYIRTPKPIDQQPDWNPLMRESASLQYYEQHDVQVEVRRRAREQQLEIDVAGDKIGDALMVFVSPTYELNGEVLNTVVTDESIFVLSDRDGEWRTRSVRPQIGEIMVEISKLVG